jgi:hypothetical protein
MKRPNALLFAFASLAIAFAAACVGDDAATSTPGGDSGADATTSNEASAADSATDTSTPDTSAPVSDAGADSACAKTFANADFCDDFDNGGYRPEWSKLDALPGVTIGLVTTPHYSSPFALSASLPTVTAAGASSVLESKTSTVGSTTFTLEARIQQPAASSSTNQKAPEALFLRISGVSSFVLFQIRPGAGMAACTAPGQQLGGFSTGDVPFAYGSWHHVTLKAVVSGGSTNVSCDVDGVPRAGTLATGLIDATATARVGMIAPDGQQPVTFLFDNVVLNATP